MKSLNRIKEIAFLVAAAIVFSVAVLHYPTEVFIAGMALFFLAVLSAESKRRTLKARCARCGRPSVAESYCECMGVDE